MSELVKLWNATCLSIQYGKIACENCVIRRKIILHPQSRVIAFERCPGCKMNVQLQFRHIKFGFVSKCQGHFGSVKETEHFPSILSLVRILVCNLMPPVCLCLNRRSTHGSLLRVQPLFRTGVY